MMRVALVNTNRIKPPISPIGLEYVAEALSAAGHRVEILDLCWEEDHGEAIERFFGERDFDLVGVTLRNTDDCAYTSGCSFLPEFADIVRRIRSSTDAPVVLGGVGFSVMPEHVLEISGAELGIWGDGEMAIVLLAERIEKGEDWRDVPNLIYRDGGAWRRNPPLLFPLADLPPMSRSWVDNPRYFREGGQLGFETKRGCTGRCIYCADPLAKGRVVRLRPPSSVADELERLIDMGIDHLHTCDSEFNIPYEHAVEVCRELERRGLGGRIRWYAYCSPRPFDRELARAMRRAGCVGINFGVDSGDEGMLKRLKRDFSPEDLIEVARICREERIAVMFDLLLGAPGETEGSVRRTVELMRKAEPDRVGVAVGVRIYPGTELAGMLGVEQEGDGPTFFLEPSIADRIFDLLDELIGGDERFFFFDPSRPDRNYNYNANELLAEAIRRGYRGAYWDILRRIASDPAFKRQVA